MPLYREPGVLPSSGLAASHRLPSGSLRKALPCEVSDIFPHIARAESWYNGSRHRCLGTGYSLSDDDPRIVVAEDTGVLLVTFRIRRNLTHFYMIGGVWVVQHQSVLAFQSFLAAIQCFIAESFFQTDTSHRTPALALDEDFAFLVLITTNLVAEEIVSAEEPFSVPSMLLHSPRSSHLQPVAACARLLSNNLPLQDRLFCPPCFPKFPLAGIACTEPHNPLPVNHEQTGYHQTLCLASFCPCFRWSETR